LTLMPKSHHYKFCFGPWNLSEGQDPYGPTTRPAQTFEWKLDQLKKLGFDAMMFHDDDAVPDRLIGCLKDPEVRVRQMAAEALARWQSPAVARRLAAALRSPDLRRPAGEVLERMGAVAAEALSEVAIGTDPEAATAAGSLIDRIVGTDPFVEGLSSIDPYQRIRSAQVLGAIGGPAASEALMGALSDPDVDVRARAASSRQERRFVQRA